MAVLITFEGIEGCGKTTQYHAFANWLLEQGHSVLLTREPGGTIIGEQIRQILLSAGNVGMTSATEALLLAASRAQLVAEIITPALIKDCIILSDRYFDASIAYQAHGRGVSQPMVQQLIEFAVHGVIPDLTILIDIDPVQSLNRARQRDLDMQLSGVADRFEREELAFHVRVRNGYLAIAHANPERVKVINGAQTIDQVSADIHQVFTTRFPSLRRGVL